VKNTQRSAIIAVALAIAVFLVALPYLLSLPPVVRFGLDRINEHLSGTLAIQSFSLGWRQGVRCDNLQYRDPVQGIEVTTPRLVSDKGLFVLLMAPRYLGAITIDHPVLTFFSAAAVHDKSKHNARETASAAPSAGENPGNTLHSSWWEERSFRLRVNNGSVTLDHGVHPVEELAKDISLTASLAVGTINYEIAFRSGLQQQGHLRAIGFVNLPAGRQSFVDTLISGTELNVSGLELAPFLDLAASRGNFPRGKGVLDANCHLVTAGIDDLDVQGTTALKGLQLSGGFLGNDRPAIDQLHFKFKGSRTAPKGWQLNTLHLESDPIRIDASGSYALAHASLDVQGEVDVQTVSKQLPHLLGLHEKTTIQEGLVDFSLNVSGTPQELDMKAHCRTGRLAIVHDGQPLSWEAPLSLVAEADRRGEQTTVRTLQLHTPFLDASGGGGAGDFTLRGTADLDRMFGELNKVFALNYHGHGKLELSGSSRLQQDGDYRIATQISIGDFTLFKGDAPVFPKHDFSLTGAVTAPATFFRDGRVQSFVFDTAAWPGKFSVVSGDIQQQSGRLRTSFAAKGTVDLGRVSDVRRIFADSAVSSRVDGSLSFDGSGSWEGKRLSLQTLNGTFAHLEVNGVSVFPQHPRATVSLEKETVANGDAVAVRDLVVADNWQDFSEQEKPVIQADFQQHRLDLRHLLVKAGTVSTRTSLRVVNWQHPQPAFVVEVNGEANTDFIGRHLQRANYFPEDLMMTGRTQASLTLRSGSGKDMVGEIVVDTDSFGLLKAKKRIVSDPKLRLTATIQGKVAGQGEVKIPKFVLDATSVHLAGNGLLLRRTPASLELQGDVTPDLAFFSKQLSAILGRRVALNGKRPGIFLFSTPMQGSLDLKRIRLAVRLPLDTLRYDKTTVQSLDIPIELSEGELQAIIFSKLYGGKLVLQPKWLIADRGRVITLPHSSWVLRNVSVQQPLLDQGLADLHPLLGAWAQPEGNVELRLNRFSLPLSAKGVGQPSCTADLRVDSLRFAARTVLRQLLDTFGLEHKGLRIKESHLACAVKNGRVNCPSIQLIAHGATIAISGETEKDGSLNYLIRMPMTEYLAGKEKFPAAQNKTIPVRITGTMDKPFFDRNVLEKDISEVLHPVSADVPTPASMKEHPRGAGQ
jgi:hypothetical protein